MKPAVIRLIANVAHAQEGRKISHCGELVEDAILVAEMHGFLNALLAIVGIARHQEKLTGIEMYLHESLAAVHVGDILSPDRQWVEVTRYPGRRLIIRSSFLDRTGDRDVSVPEDLWKPELAGHFAFAIAG